MTWFSYQNFGTALQAYALCNTLSAMNCEPHLINYDPTTGFNNQVQPHRSLYERISGKTKVLMGYRPLSCPERDDAFNSFIRDKLPLSPAVKTEADFSKINESFDFFICGSDQIWSPRAFDPRYFLDFVKNDGRKIAYAPSFGCESLGGFAQSKEITRLMKSFSHISVREMSAVKIVQRATGRTPEVVLDPTLLLTEQQWIDALGERKTTSEPYCLMYFLGTDKRNPQIARKIARQHHLGVVSIPVFQRDIKAGKSAAAAIGPSEFVSLIANAELICTDSFHGAAFSTTFKRPLVVFERFNPNSSDSQNTRIYSFLELTGLEGTLLSRDNLDNWKDHVEIEYDYSGAHDRLSSLRKTSLDYLTSSLLSE